MPQISTKGEDLIVWPRQSGGISWENAGWNISVTGMTIYALESVLENNNY